ncbi:hypothetical protein CCP1ISM_50043 [Azospirillaceae bacterium]
MYHRIKSVSENSSHMPIVNLTANDNKRITKNLHRLMAKALRRYNVLHKRVLCPKV